MRSFHVTEQEYRAALLTLARMWTAFNYRPVKLGKASEAVKSARWALGCQYEPYSPAA